ncbi:Nitrogen permease regulator 3 [Entophlyctis sp. JEL0112]|nr:Nitrogen permease regulator 3 [Entophlyctis sp. JEL0112]
MPVVLVLLVCYSSRSDIAFLSQHHPPSCLTYGTALSRGHQIVFHYPLPSQANELVSSLHQPTSAHTAVPTQLSRPNVPPSANPSHLSGGSDLLLGFEPQFLSDMLSPKGPLCDRIFKLCIDDMVFIGDPTLLNADRLGLIVVASTVLLTWNSGFTATGNQFIRRIQHKKLLKQKLADSLNDDTTPEMKSAVNSEESPNNQKSLTVGQLQLTMFNIIFTLAPGNDDCVKDHEVQYLYKNIISKLSAGLKYEQLRRGYLRKEIDIIMGVRDELHNGAGTFIKPDTMPAILQKSSLAQLLADAFVSLNSSNDREISHLHLELNSSVDISILVNDNLGNIRNENEHEAKKMNRFKSSEGKEEMPLANNSLSLYPWFIGDDEDGSFGYDYMLKLFNATPLRPYHAILLMYHAEEILKSLPTDSASLLHDLIEVVTPMQSFEMLALALNCPLSQIYRLGLCFSLCLFLLAKPTKVSHLVCWRKAKVIDVIHSSCIYMVAKDADLSRLSNMEGQYAGKDLDLGKLLAELSQPRPLNSIFKDKNVPFLEIIALFLRNDLVEQFRQTYYIKVPKKLLQGLTEVEILDVEEDVIIRNPSEASAEEQKLIAAVAATQPEPFKTVFTQLSKYFDGHFHVEEILFREKISRKDFRAVVSFYRDYLLTAYSSARDFNSWGGKFNE